MAGRAGRVKRIVEARQRVQAPLPDHAARAQQDHSSPIGTDRRGVGPLVGLQCRPPRRSIRKSICNDDVAGAMCGNGVLAACREGDGNDVEFSAMLSLQDASATRPVPQRTGTPPVAASRPDGSNAAMNTPKRRFGT